MRCLHFFFEEVLVVHDVGLELDDFVLFAFLEVATARLDAKSWDHFVFVLGFDFEPLGRLLEGALFRRVDDVPRFTYISEKILSIKKKVCTVQMIGSFLAPSVVKVRKVAQNTPV